MECINGCVEFIHSCNARLVALQLPSNMLPLSSTLVGELEEQTGCKCVVIADATYSPCCVDITSAKHLKSIDCIIHFGDACFSACDCDIPVLYAFPHKELDIAILSTKINGLLESEQLERLAIVYNPVYSKRIVKSSKDLDNLTSGKSYTTLIAYPHVPQEGFNRIGVFLQDSNILDIDYMYIGTCNDSYVTNLQLNRPLRRIWVYNPELVNSTPQPLSCNINRVLMRRYYLIEKAQDASLVGVVVGSVGFVDSLKVLDRVKQLLKMSGKKYYVLLVGKINDAKLANFPEIDIFVNIACCFSSIIDTFAYIQDIITPFELEIALGGKEWSGEFSTDATVVLGGTYDHVCVSEESRHSLVSRTMVDNVVCDNSDTQLILKQNDRTFKGLETKIGETTVSKASKGRFGIAKHYESMN